MKKAIILSGVSGSGKSTYIQKMIEEFRKQEKGEVYEPMLDDFPNYNEKSFSIVSADHFFTNSYGEYKFFPAGLSTAHASCFRHFIESLQNGVPYVFADNTNCSAIEMSPYVLAANAFGYQHEIVRLRGSLGKCHARNIHQVPLRSIENQMEKFVHSYDLPPWWNVRYADTE